jgi:hypothetical protein
VAVFSAVPNEQENMDEYKVVGHRYYSHLQPITNITLDAGVFVSIQTVLFIASFLIFSSYSIEYMCNQKLRILRLFMRIFCEVGSSLHTISGDPVQF